MGYTYDRQEKVEKIIASCRPEFDDVDFWAEQINKKLSAEELDQHCLYLTSRVDELMDETTSGKFSIGSAEHSLELVKLAEVANHLEAVEAALERQ